MKDLQNICFTCLSIDRNLYSLQDIEREFPCPINIDLIFKKCELNQPTKICWECKAVLMKISHFTGQAVTAREALMQVYHDQLESVTQHKKYPLSKLKKRTLKPVIFTSHDSLSENQLDITQSPIINEVIFPGEIKNERDIKVEIEVDHDYDDGIIVSPLDIPKDPIGDTDEQTINEGIDTKTCKDEFTRHKIFTVPVNSLIKNDKSLSEIKKEKEKQKTASKNKVTLKQKTKSENKKQSNIVLRKILPKLRGKEQKLKVTSENPVPLTSIKIKTGTLPFSGLTLINGQKLDTELLKKFGLRTVQPGAIKKGDKNLIAIPINQLEVLNDSKETLQKEQTCSTNSKKAKNIRSRIEKNSKEAVVENETDALNIPGTCGGPFASDKLDPSKIKMGETYKLSQKPDAINAFTVTRVSYEEMIRLREKRRAHKSFIKTRLKCLQCVMTFHGNEEYNTHVELHDRQGDFKCDICGIAFPVKSDLKQHVDAHTWYYKCCSCDFGSLWFKFIVGHVEDHHEKHSMLCRDCDAVVYTPYEMKMHRRAAHRKEVPPCEHCGQRFTTPLMLREHLKRHAKDYVKPVLECPKCDKTFGSEIGLKVHVKWRHEKNAAAYCVECDKYFLHQNTFDKHIKYSKAHNSSENFKYICKICGHKFAKSAYLKEHEILKHSDRKDFKCEHCTMEFNNKRKLKAHTLKYHEGYVRPKDKICDFCGKGFTAKKLLRQHLNVHTGARPFVCLFCGATFTQSGSLCTHVKLKHKKEKRNT